jgi:hypothetical protein
MSNVIEEPLKTAMERMLAECQGDPDAISERISGVLEFLTMRSVNDAPYYIMTDNGDALVVFAANESATELRELLPDTYKSWDEPLDDVEFLTDQDPGDEQEDDDESTS